MSLKNLVPDLQSCKKLPKGMETLFKRVYNPIAENYFIVLTSVGEITLSSDAEFYPAPTVQELLDIMPNHINGDQCAHFLELDWGFVKGRKQKYYEVNYGTQRMINENYAQALADLYNWCVDNGHIEKIHEEIE